MPPRPAIGGLVYKRDIFCSLPLDGDQNSLILTQRSLSTLPQLSERVHQGAERWGHLEAVPQQRHHPGRGDHPDYPHHQRYLVQHPWLQFQSSSSDFPAACLVCVSLTERKKHAN